MNKSQRGRLDVFRNDKGLAVHLILLRDGIVATDCVVDNSLQNLTWRCCSPATARSAAHLHFILLLELSFNWTTALIHARPQAVHLCQNCGVQNR